MTELRTELVVEPAPGHSWSRPQLSALVTLCLLLAAIVGMASAATPWSGNGSSGGTAAPPLVVDALVLVLAAALCVLVATVWLLTPGGKRTRRPANALETREMGVGLRTGLRVLAAGLLVVVTLIAAYSFLLARAGGPAEPSPLGGSGAAAAGSGSAHGTGAASAVSPTFQWFVLGLIGATAVVAPLALVVRRRLRVSDPARPEDPSHERVARAVADSIDDIERDADARRAVIRAYGRMERAFGEAGAPRRPAEAPFEFVERALRGLQVSPAAAGRLAGLFEHARFSSHAVRPETKEEAVGSLREIQRELGQPR
jgi:hypothetical protein